MSDRDGVLDDDYDALRATGLTREQCWAVIDVVRDPMTPPPNASDDAQNRRQSGVRPRPGPPAGPPGGPPAP